MPTNPNPAQPYVASNPAGLPMSTQSGPSPSALPPNGWPGHSSYAQMAASQMQYQAQALQLQAQRLAAQARQQQDGEERKTEMARARETAIRAQSIARERLSELQRRAEGLPRTLVPPGQIMNPYLNSNSNSNSVSTSAQPQPLPYPHMSKPLPTMKEFLNGMTGIGEKEKEKVESAKEEKKKEEEEVLEGTGEATSPILNNPTAPTPAPAPGPIASSSSSPSTAAESSKPVAVVEQKQDEAQKTEKGSLMRGVVSERTLEAMKLKLQKFAEAFGRELEENFGGDGSGSATSEKEVLEGEGEKVVEKAQAQPVTVDESKERVLLNRIDSASARAEALKYEVDNLKKTLAETQVLLAKSRLEESSLRNQLTATTAGLGSHVSTASASATLKHGATCDLCDKTIIGTRHKCLQCPDFDTCTSCFPNIAFVHPGHTFVPINTILRTSPRPSDSVLHSGVLCAGCNKTVRGPKYVCPGTHSAPCGVALCGNCLEAPGGPRHGHEGRWGDGEVWVRVGVPARRWWGQNSKESVGVEGRAMEMGREEMKEMAEEGRRQREERRMSVAGGMCQRVCEHSKPKSNTVDAAIDSETSTSSGTMPGTLPSPFPIASSTPPQMFVDASDLTSELDDINTASPTTTTRPTIITVEDDEEDAELRAALAASKAEYEQERKRQEREDRQLEEVRAASRKRSEERRERGRLVRQQEEEKVLKMREVIGEMKTREKEGDAQVEVEVRKAFDKAYEEYMKKEHEQEQERLEDETEMETETVPTMTNSVALSGMSTPVTPMRTSEEKGKGRQVTIEDEPELSVAPTFAPVSAPAAVLELAEPVKPAVTVPTRTSTLPTALPTPAAAAAPAPAPAPAPQSASVPPKPRDAFSTLWSDISAVFDKRERDSSGTSVPVPLEEKIVKLLSDLTGVVVPTPPRRMESGTSEMGEPLKGLRGERKEEVKKEEKVQEKKEETKSERSMTAPPPLENLSDDGNDEVEQALARAVNPVPSIPAPARVAAPTPASVEVKPEDARAMPGLEDVTDDTDDEVNSAPPRAVAWLRPPTGPVAPVPASALTIDKVETEDVPPPLENTSDDEDDARAPTPDDMPGLMDDTDLDLDSDWARARPTTTTAATATAPQPEPTPVVPNLDARFVDDVTIGDGTSVPSGAVFHKIWRVRNNGNVAWPAGTKLVYIRGALKGSDAVVDQVEAGKVVELEVKDVHAPEEEGDHHGVWRLVKDGKEFGDRLWISIHVDAPGSSNNSLGNSMLASSSSIIVPAMRSGGKTGPSNPSVVAPSETASPVVARPATLPSPSRAASTAVPSSSADDSSSESELSDLATGSDLDGWSDSDDFVYDSARQTQVQPQPQVQARNGCGSGRSNLSQEEEFVEVSDGETW